MQDSHSLGARYLHMVDCDTACSSLVLVRARPTWVCVRPSCSLADLNSLANSFTCKVCMTCAFVKDLCLTCSRSTPCMTEGSPVPSTWLRKGSCCCSGFDSSVDGGCGEGGGGAGRGRGAAWALWMGRRTVCTWKAPGCAGMGVSS